MFGFRRRRDLTPSDAGKLLAKLRDNGMSERARRRAMTDQLRADLRAKGHDLPPIDWASL